MAEQQDDREVARILNLVERAFGRGTRLPPLELDLRQRIEKSKRGGVSVTLGSVLALAAAAGLMLGKWHRPHQPAGKAQSLAVVQRIPVLRPDEPVPVTTGTGQPAPPRRIAVRTSRRGTVRRIARPPQPVREATREPDSSDGGRAVPLTGEALRRALVQDRIRTRQLNEDELRNLDAPS